MRASIFRAQYISLADVPEPCIPEADPANKLATFKAKAVKDKIATPFPYMELSEFLPRWVTTHVALSVRRCAHILPSA